MHKDIKMQSLNTKRNKPKSRLCTATLSFVHTHSSGRLFFLKFPNTSFIYLVYGKGTIEQLLKGGMNSGKASRVPFQCSLGSTYSHAGISKLSQISCLGVPCPLSLGCEAFPLCYGVVCGC